MSPALYCCNFVFYTCSYVMPTDPAITRILGRTQLYKKVSVFKVFDLAEEVNAALVRTGRTADWLANEMGISIEALTDLLSGMHTFYDPIARMEAALSSDLMIGATLHNRFFQNDQVSTDESSFAHDDSFGNIDMVVLPGVEFDKFYGVRWHNEEFPRQRTVSATISSYLREDWDNIPVIDSSLDKWLKK